MGAPAKAFPSFSLIGILYCCVLLVVILPTVVLFGYVWGSEHRSSGLSVFIGAAHAERSPAAWKVRVESANKWYLNLERIAPGEMEIRLREIQKFGGCTVVFDGRSDLSYGDAVHAMDMIEESGATVLLMPQTGPNEVR